jgi:hypothetical protein
MLARALRPPDSKFWASFTLAVVSGAEADDSPWEDFIERGNRRNSMSDEGPARIPGPHWGILADCQAMAGVPEECAKIWEHQALEILKPAADLTGRRLDEVLLLLSYQLVVSPPHRSKSSPNS